MTANRQAGFSIMEIFLVSTLGLGLAFLASKLLDRTQKADQNEQQASNENVNLLNAYEHVLRVGRTAYTCRKPVDATEIGLQCRVPNRQRSLGAMKTVRFLLSSADVPCKASSPCLLFQVEEGAGWTTQIEYAGITKFEVCDTSVITGGTCKLEPASQSAAFTTNLVTNTGLNERFVRFTIQSESFAQNKILQGAFFARNSPSISGTVIVEGAR